MHAVGTGVTPPGAVVPRLAPGPAPSRCAAPLPLREPTGVAGLAGLARRTTRPLRAGTGAPARPSPRDPLRCSPCRP